MKRCLQKIAIITLVMTTILYPSAIGNEAERASVLIDMGDGRYYWAELEIGSNRTAINLTERAAESLGLTIKVIWYSFGAFVSELGEVDCNYPKYWHFYLWNSSSGRWTLSSIGMSSYLLNDGDVISLLCAEDYSDWSTPLPVPTPMHPHPSTMFRVNLQNTGYGYGRAPEEPSIKWDLDTGKLEIDSSPSVGWGMVFITGTNGFYGIDQESGEILWEKEGIKGMSSPALYDGKVVVGAADGRVYCLDAGTGAIIWSTMVQPNPWRQSITSSPKISSNLVYIGTFNESGGNAAVVALSLENGSVVWRYETASIYVSSPAVYGDVIYIGVAGYAVDHGFSFEPPYGLLALSSKNGSLIWMYKTDERVVSSPLVSGESIYITSRDGYLYSINMDGSLNWRIEVGQSTSSPAMLGDILYIGTGLLGGVGSLVAIKTNGTILWEYEIDGPIQSSPLVADQKVYFSTNEPEGKIYCLDALKGRLLWEFQPEPANHILSSPVLADGELFIASDNGHVYALSDESTEQDLGYLSAITPFLVVALVASISSILMLIVLARRKKK